MKAAQVTTLPILLRSTLEAYVDFVNVLHQKDYFKRMYVSYLSSKVSMLQAAHDEPDNQYLKLISHMEGLRQELKNTRRELASLRQEGHRPLEIPERFSLAKMEDLYSSVYALLCKHSHNDVSSLEDRHLEKSNGQYQVVFFAELDPSRVFMYLDTLAGLLNDSSLKIHGTFKTGSEGKFDLLSCELAELRDHVVQNEETKA